LEGVRFFRATGSVVFTRDSLRARADSLEYDQDQNVLVLSKEASVTTAQTDLTAESIRLDIPQDEVREALASGEAVLVGEDLRLLAPFITLFFTEGRMERLVAVRDYVADSILAGMDEDERERARLLRGVLPDAARAMGFDEFPVHPYAMTEDFALVGDSVEVRAPGEILDEVKAMGGARGETTGRDTLNTADTPPLIARDWLEGDTIVAFFQEEPDSLLEGDSLQAPEDPLSEPMPVVPDMPEVIDADSAETEYRLQRLLAQGTARSMYRMAASDSTIAADPGRFAIHYVVGDEILILLNDAGEAERMEVTGQTRGIHLEPVGPTGVAVDTIAVDTVAVDSLAVDTVVVPDTARVSRRGGATLLKRKLRGEGRGGGGGTGP
jgi:hypothetical protein